MLQQVGPPHPDPERAPALPLQHEEGEAAATQQQVGGPPHFSLQEQQEAPLSAADKPLGVYPTDRSNDSTGFSPAAAAGLISLWVYILPTGLTTARVSLLLQQQEQQQQQQQQQQLRKKLRRSMQVQQ
ncbi:uncharacterized protein EMH_0051550 [Eimeria mitis]|uniref:Uncharacterized protein n=1 Tax=Eimeria mitis TaxID=44415 RepID=U6JVZ7_9EIME|nr:uncharacterized protein EMH_0051550 [Eimeria mitis]CDJ29650.1 hypothetical protein EMH_0051550 [Eimeria mitis]